MFRRISILIGGLAVCAALMVLSGCSTAAAKKALNKPYEEDAYTAFGQNKMGEDSERKAQLAEPVGDEMEPEKAIDILVDDPEAVYAIRRSPMVH